MTKTVKPIGPAVMAVGCRYKVMHGGSFDCIEVYPSGAAKLRSVMSGATFIAANITAHEDGSISWTNADDLHYTGRPEK